MDALHSEGPAVRAADGPLPPPETSTPMGIVVRRSRSEGLATAKEKGRKRSTREKSEGRAAPKERKKDRKRRKTRQSRKREKKDRKLARSEAARERPPSSPLLALPSEMLILVLSFLSYSELTQLRSVCRSLGRISTDVTLLNSLGRAAGCAGRSYVPLECKFEAMEICSRLHTREMSNQHQSPAYRKIDMDYAAVTSSRSSPSRKGSFLKWRSVSSLFQLSSAGFSRLSPRSPRSPGRGSPHSSPDLPVKGLHKRGASSSSLQSPEHSERKQRGKSRRKRDDNNSRANDEERERRLAAPLELPTLQRAGRKERVTIFACGPPAVGVSSLVSRYLWRKFSHKSEPTIYERHQFEVMLDGILVEVDLLETQGHPKYAALRKSAMAEAEGFLLAYSSTSSRSLLSLKADIIPALRWARESRGSDVPAVLAACQEDCVAVREVAYEMGEELAEELATPFFETSAKYAVNVSTAFETIIRMVLRSQKRKAGGASGASGAAVRRTASGPSSHGRK